MKAVIFDLDGVIVDSEPLNDRHMATYLKSLGIDFAEVTANRSLRGMNSKTLWTTLKKEYGLKHTLDDLINGARRDYMDFLKSLPDIPAVPGAVELVGELKELGFKLGLGSSAHSVRINLFLEKTNLTDAFRVVVSGDDVIKGKPDPEVFVKVASQLDESPSNCIVIEDSSAGVASAKGAGMFCIGFDGLEDNNEDLSGADLIVSDLSRLVSDKNWLD